MIRRFLIIVSAVSAIGFAQDAEKLRDFVLDGGRKIRLFAPVIVGAQESIIEIVDDSDSSVCLGTIISKDGLILTKASMLQGTPICVLRDGRELKAKVVGISENDDIALLRVEAKDLKPLTFQKTKIRIGQWVVTPGLENDEPIAVGVVSVLPRRIPGRSGFLGVSIEDAEGGVRVTQVVPNSAAERVGVEIDDIIIAINGVNLATVEKFVEAVGTNNPGDRIKIAIKRKSETLNLEATLGKREEETRSSNRRGSRRRRRPSTRGLSPRRMGFPTAMQHDTVLDSTDCGGPIMNLSGQVVGLNIARSGRTQSLAVPSSTILSILADLKSGKLDPSKKKKKSD